MAESAPKTVSIRSHPGHIPPPIDLQSHPSVCGLSKVKPIPETSLEHEDMGRGRDKDAIISQILELQSTLHDLSQRVNTVKEENSKLKAENQVLDQYIQNLMVTSGVFKSTK